MVLFTVQLHLIELLTLYWSTHSLAKQKKTKCYAPFGCKEYVTYQEAYNICEDSGMRLCHPSEFRRNLCCLDCFSGKTLVWRNGLESMYF